MTKQRSFSIILTINIMQLRGMSWRVLRCFKTSVVNVLRLLRPLIWRIHQSKYNFLSGIEWKKRRWPLFKVFTAGRLLSRPVKLQKLPLNCTVLRNVMASLLLFVIVRHSRVWLLRLPIHRSHQSKLPILS